MITLKTLLFYVAITILAQPSEAQQFEIYDGKIDYGSVTTPEIPFYISEDNIHGWKSCDDIKNEKMFELCIQRGAADATIRSSEILYWQTWLGGFALLSAIAAAIFTGYAALQARKGVSVALKIGAAGIRPYINLDIKIEELDKYHETDDEKGIYKVVFSINNTGKSEAIVCDIHFVLINVPKEDPFFDKIFDFETKDDDISQKSGKIDMIKVINHLFGENLCVYPQQELVKLETTIRDSLIEKALSKKEDMAFGLSFDYKDSVGTKYRSAYSHRVRFKKSTAEGKQFELQFDRPIILQQDSILENPKFSIWKT